MVTPLISIVMHVQVLDTIEIHLTQRILGCSGGISDYHQQWWGILQLLMLSCWWFHPNEM